MNTSESAIAIAACGQHHLERGKYPGPEYRARLDRTAGIYLGDETAPYGDKKYVFTLGSHHNGDARSLSKAGQEYLMEKYGITSSGIDTINEVRPKGIYHGADEIAFLAEIKRRSNEEGSRYNPISKVVVVANVSQYPRLKLHAKANSFEPEFVGVRSGEDYHSGLSEKLLLIYTLFDGTWQGKFSPVGNLLRYLRRPTTEPSVNPISKVRSIFSSLISRQTLQSRSGQAVTKAI